jgi:hypothetical protein
MLYIYIYIYIYIYTVQIIFISYIKYALKCKHPHVYVVQTRIKILHRNSRISDVCYIPRPNHPFDLIEHIYPQTPKITVTNT